MRANQIPFNKGATIYKSDKFICIESLSGASAMMYRDNHGYGIYLQLDATDETLGQVLIAALDRSRFVPWSEREFFDANRAKRAYENWQKDFMTRYGYKSKRDAYKNMDWCRAKISEEKISIEPHRRDTPGSWKSLPRDRTVVIAETRDVKAVGAALRLALDRCE